NTVDPGPRPRDPHAERGNGRGLPTPAPTDRPEDSPMRLQPRRRDSSGTAAVEFAAVAPLLLLLLLGLWEVGRAIQVQQILSNAAREGARAAAQAQIVNAVGAYTRIGVTTGAPNVTGTVRAYLVGEGITNHTGLDVKFEFLIPDGSGGMMVDTSRSQPYE